MKILVAKDAGYCFGVRDAVNLATKTGAEYDSVYMLGDIVHNERVVSDLEKSGSRVVNDLSDIPEDKPVLFRAHGTDPKVWKEAQKKKLNIIDATCPLVTEIHEEIKILESENRKTIIIGDHGHDEVMGIAAQVKKPIVISNVDEAKKIGRLRKAGVVTQSTQMIENVQEIVSILMEKVYDLRFVNTICYPTRKNHTQIKELAKISDVMVIIGSFTSANSKRLTELAKQRNDNSYQVIDENDIKEEWFKDVSTVGVSAGASTPDNIINNVIEKINSISNLNSKEEIYE